MLTFTYNRIGLRAAVRAVELSNLSNDALIEMLGAQATVLAKRMAEGAEQLSGEQLEGRCHAIVEIIKGLVVWMGNAHAEDIAGRLPDFESIDLEVLFTTDDNGVDHIRFKKLAIT